MNSPQQNRTSQQMQQHAEQKRPAPKRFILIFVCVVIGLFIAGVVPRIFVSSELKKAHDETVGAVPVVHTVLAAPANATEAITLPGNIQAILYATIYARVDGYLRSRCVDIGDNVKQGQLLAEIDTPTVDEQLNQGKADLVQAQAQVLTAKAQLKEAHAKQDSAQAQVEKGQSDVDFARVTADRWQDLALRGAVSVQSKDEKVRGLNAQTAQLKADQANLKVAVADVKAAAANVQVADAGVVAKLAAVRKVTDEQSFKNVLAPFDGVITARKVDPGALITQGSQTSSLELFQMAKIDRLRIYVSVPQRVSRYLKDGMNADVLVQEWPDRKFIGKVTNVSGALDPNTRTRMTEIQIDNPDHTLLPGMYAEVRISNVREAPWIRVPGTTIVTKPDGQYVVTVIDSKAHYQRVTIGRDFGDEIEIRTGLKGQEQVVISPSDDLREGDKVDAKIIKQDS